MNICNLNTRTLDQFPILSSPIRINFNVNRSLPAGSASNSVRPLANTFLLSSSSSSVASISRERFTVTSVPRLSIRFVWNVGSFKPYSQLRSDWSFESLDWRRLRSDTIGRNLIAIGTRLCCEPDISSFDVARGHAKFQKNNSILSLDDNRVLLLSLLLSLFHLSKVPATPTIPPLFLSRARQVANNSRNYQLNRQPPAFVLIEMRGRLRDRQLLEDFSRSPINRQIVRPHL